MFRALRRSFVCAVLGLLGAAAAALASSTSAAANPTRLVVVVAVDGLSWSRLSGYRAWFSGGFKRLLDSGQVETQCNYQHINTETGPGHASLGTGAPPRVHGIVANRWSELASDGTNLRRTYCTDQSDPWRVPGQPPFFYREVLRDGRRYVFAAQKEFEAWQLSGELGKSTTRIGAGTAGETLAFDSDDAVGAYDLRHGTPPASFPGGSPIPGPANLRVDTLADRLAAASPSSRVVSLSGKDRGAIFLAGRSASHIVYWYDHATGRFRSSNAYNTDGVVGSEAKTLVEDFNRANGGGMLLRRFGTLWRALPQPAAGSELPQPARDLADFQVPRIGLGFDHDLARQPDGYFEAIYGSPFQDELLTDLALAVLSSPKLRLGQRDVADLLALSFSAHDVVAHDFGSESEEELDTLRRLDLQLGRLLEALDRGRPPGSVVLALSADHGFTALPEVTRRAAVDKRVGGRLLTNERVYPNFLQVLNRELAQALCVDDDPKNPLVLGGDGWTMVYNRPTLPRQARPGCAPGRLSIDTADLDRTLPGLLRGRFEEDIEDVLLVSQRDAWPSGGLADFARNDFDAARSGDLFLVPRDNVLLHWDPARGSGHGSPYEHDTHVPLIFWGAPFTAGERSEPTTPYDLAPTLAELLGIKLPDATGKSRLPPATKAR